ncbi:MAG TPA: EcsC family protein [Patescibacteria group bacterium]|nr:EcsC family protein [Patescibacteria group bacterium]
MISYNDKALRELNDWKSVMKKKPSIIQKTTKGVQNKFNNMLPDKYHEIITSVIKSLTNAVLYGSKYVAKPPIKNLSLMERERLVKEKTKFYKNTAIIEGAATGAGGIIMGLTDLPLLLSIKIKFLYDVASIYGFDANDYSERLYLLHIFQLAFSSKGNVNKIFEKMQRWEEYSTSLPDDINHFDWKNFQQEYRDFIDMAKLLQMMPGIGAVVGSYVNHNLMKKLSETAIQAYRMRILGSK